MYYIKQASQMRLISWNVNGIRATMKKGFEDTLKTMAPDVLCLQETKASVDQTMEALAPIQDYKIFANDSKARKGYSGTAILSREEPVNVTFDIGIEEHDQEGRVTTAEYKDYFLVDVYVPNSGSGLKRLDYRQEWDKAFSAYLNQLGKAKPVIMTGDLNVARKPIDLARPDSNYDVTAGYTQAEIDGLEHMIQENDFVDSYRHLHPEKVQYSFWNQRFRARDRNVGWRIDYFMVPSSMINNVKEAFILDQIMGSDHCPVGIVLN